jgi:hypothetical protein
MRNEEFLHLFIPLELTYLILFYWCLRKHEEVKVCFLYGLNYSFYRFASPQHPVDNERGCVSIERGFGM